MTKSITKIKDLGYGWTGTLYSDGTMRVQGDLQESDCIDLPKASVDRLARIFKEIQEEMVQSNHTPMIPYTSNGKNRRGTKNMTKYYVGLTIYNTFEVEADSESEAEEKVRDLSVHATLDEADYNITYVDEIST